MAYENKLNAHRYTYSWEFSLLTQSGLKIIGDKTHPLASLPNYTDLDLHKVVIAENGVTPYTIDNIKLGSTSSPKTYSGTSAATNIDFEIFEPNGARMLEFLAKAADWAGLKTSYRTSKYLLTLKFIDTDTGVHIPEFTKVYVIVIVRVETTITTAGAKYTFHATSSSDLSKSNVYDDVTTSFNITEKVGQRVSDIFAELATSINDEIKTRRTSNFDSEYGTTRYFIKVNEESFGPLAAKLILDSSPEGSGSHSSTSDETEAGGVVTPAKSSLQDIIDSIMKHTKAYQEQVQLNKNSNKDDSSSDDITFHVILRDSKLTAYNPVAKMAHYDLTYEIMAYTSSNIHTKEDINYVNFNQISSRIRAKYDYIFTSKNTEVLDLDINFDFLWYVDLPSEYNAGSNTASFGSRMPANKVSDAPPSNKAKMDKYIANSLAAAPAGSEAARGTHMKKYYVHNIDTLIKQVKGTIEKSNEPTVIVQAQDNNNSATQAVSENSNYSTSLVAAAFNQFTGTTDMLNIDLKIRGNPSLMPSALNDPSPLKRKLVSEENLIWLEMYMPDLTYNPDGAQSRVDLLSGIYILVLIDSEFSNGTFTQTLKATRHTRMLQSSVPAKAQLNPGLPSTSESIETKNQLSGVATPTKAGLGADDSSSRNSSNSNTSVRANSGWRGGRF